VASDGAGQVVPRPALRDALLDSSARVVVLEGESGSGKTILLSDACSTAAGHGTLICGPYEVFYTDELVTVVLRLFGDAVAAMFEEQSLSDRIAERLQLATERLIADKGRELVVAVGREIFGFVRARLGAEAGDALREAWSALGATDAESLTARLDRQSKPLVREIVVEFAREIQALVPGGEIVLALDRCERFNEDSMRLLADLAEILPPGVSIWAASQPMSALSVLETAGADSIAVPPFAASEIQALLPQATPVSPDDVLHQVGGIALDVQAYLGRIERHLNLDAPKDEVLLEDVASRLSSTSPNAQRVANALAILGDPLPVADLANITQITQTQVSACLAELEVAGLVESRPSGLSLHERRSAALLRAMDDEARTELSDRGAQAVRDYVERSRDERWLGKLATLAHDSATLRAEAPELEPILNLHADTLRLVAAIIELTEPSSPALDARGLLGYARTAWALEVDAVQRLAELEAAELVHVAASNNVAVVVARISRLGTLVAAGRIALELGRLPVANAASVAFEQAIRPRLGQFAMGAYGLGHPSAAHMARDLRRPPPERAHEIISRNLGQTGIFLKARQAQRPFWAVVRFDDISERNRALDALEGIAVDVVGERFEIASVVSHPIGVVPADRFVVALERAIGRHIPETSWGSLQIPLTDPLDLRRGMERRIAAARTLRQLCSHAERLATGLDEPVGFHWAPSDEALISVTVIGGREGAFDFQPPAGVRFGAGPYELISIAESLRLHPSEWIVSVEWSSSVPRDSDPLGVEIAKRRQGALAFNDTQPQELVAVDETLPQRLCGAFFRQLEDAREFVRNGLVNSVVPPTALYAVIAQEDPTTPEAAHWVPGSRSVVHYAEGLSTSGDDECHIHFVPGIMRPNDAVGVCDPPDDSLAILVDDNPIHQSGQSMTLSFVARMLGCRQSDLRFGRDAAP
jgi:hypothetical protein